MATHMILERSFDPPLTLASAHALAAESGWCMELYRITWNVSFVATSGRTMTCWFTAPDAESMRLALRRAGSDIRRLWPGSVHEGPEPAVPNVLVERSFDEPVTLEQIQAIEDASAWCLRAHQVKFARTFFSTDRKRMLCLYQAPDAEAVRLAQREAEMPVSAVWAFDRMGPDTLAAHARR